MAKKNNFKFFETSSKTGYNINEIMNEIVSDIYKNNNFISEIKTLSLNDSNDSIKSKSEHKKKRKNCC